MEVYTLDPLLRRTEVIDRFESLIWTERWLPAGDFELAIRSTYENRNLLTEGTMLALDRSHRVMTVETVEDGVSDDGKEILRVKGTSIEDIFGDRTAMGSKATLTTTPTWDLTGLPAAVMRKIVTDICVTGILDVEDKIPFIVNARHPAYPASTITEPVDPIAIKLEPTDVYTVLQNLGNTWLLGIRLLRNGDSSQLYFDVYAGTDRTASQTARPPVIFSPDLDNLKNTKEFRTIENAKNVANVYSPFGFLEVFGANIDPDIDGFDRKVLTVVAGDITNGTTEQVNAQLMQRGREALSEHRAFQAFDGEISQNSQFVYERDYYLGDLVEMRNQDGVGNHMRVSEQIFVSDSEGDRAYPTLMLNTFVSTGSWLSWPGTKQWIDYDSDPITWSEAP